MVVYYTELKIDEKWLDNCTLKKIKEVDNSFDFKCCSCEQGLCSYCKRLEEKKKILVKEWAQEKIEWYWECDKKDCKYTHLKN